ncbi:Uncharacterized protein OS=Sorangium cellulosum So0157-2 GN=SCE1572_47170 PE=4 SV=1 [Gemmata massiliana]|uniref:Uncharacterized protein n=1 Tax=Gemmata massiliana TaxID=1210884 RepID=A0A6P2CX09_9BACT|nr:hypothetical protein [Gemmata massiliana]VTR92926.1 Uncharacterized protein OS=Sorangium cellulosum So0157-2 GN=SCE1572_47170 PE=4 SV=1 [Gemmata massiliana]
MPLSAEELLAGGAANYDVIIPPALLGQETVMSERATVRIRPLTVRDLQRIQKAAGEDDSLSAALVLHQAIVAPALKFEQVSQLPAGLARFLIEQVNAFSGISVTADNLTELVQTPLVRACFTLAKEFGWTPDEVSGMTIGQILLYLEMVRSEGTAS